MSGSGRIELLISLVFTDMGANQSSSGQDRLRPVQDCHEMHLMVHSVHQTVHQVHAEGRCWTDLSASSLLLF